MAILPWHDKIVEADVFSKEQMRWVAFTQYFMMLLCLATLTWLIYNAWKILIKKQKYRVLPLTNFYFLSLILVVFRIYFQVVVFPAVLLHWVFVMLYG